MILNNADAIYVGSNNTQVYMGGTLVFLDGDSVNSFTIGSDLFVKNAGTINGKVTYSYDGNGDPQSASTIKWDNDYEEPGTENKWVRTAFGVPSISFNADDTEFPWLLSDGSIVQTFATNYTYS
jgi:hypothetical protein